MPPKKKNDDLQRRVENLNHALDVLYGGEGPLDGEQIATVASHFLRLARATVGDEWPHTTAKWVNKNNTHIQALQIILQDPALSAERKLVAIRALVAFQHSYHEAVATTDQRRANFYRREVLRLSVPMKKRWLRKKMVVRK
jgi:hypothetical protein